MSEPIWTLDACEIADRVRSGELAAKEVLETCLERIDAYNAELNAFVHLDPESSRAEAAEVDRRVAAGEDPGPLAGVPVGIKDLEHVRGMPTTFGSAPYRDNVAVRDDVQVERLRAAGAVIVGKTAAPEFGSTAYTSTPLHGTTHNPWNLDRTPGGSSGGSAAAVAAGLIPLATASDGGGSTRIPASYTGLFGPKVSYGRVPKGDGPDFSQTSVHGPISRSVRDTARHLDAVIGAHERDRYSLPHPGFSYEQTLGDTPSGLRAVWSQDLGFGACASEVAGIVRAAADTLADTLGLTWIDRTVELKDPSVAWGLLNLPGTWLEVEPHWAEREEDFTQLIRMGVHLGRERVTMEETARAVERRWLNDQTLAEVFEQADLIVTPTTSTTAFAADGPMPTEIDGERIKPMHAITFTYPFNVSGHPAVSIPCGVDADGLPVGLQVVTRRHDDHVLLRIAAAFERAHPWTTIAPAYAP